MRRWWWMTTIGVLVLLAAAALAVRWWWTRDEPVAWTTRSPEALEVFEQGLHDLSRYYFADARERFERAMELDPEFVLARLHLVLVLPATDPRHDELLAELADTDLERLDPRERWLVEYWLARTGGEPEAARRVLDAYLEQHPDDAYALFTRCGEHWMAQSWDEADACYRRLIGQHPNWVLAQNRLGFIAMARGRFSEAEEHFRTYRFIAPDQAAPYGSLGQLLTILGRYDEAETALRQALAIKHDFCDAHLGLIRMYMLSGRLDQAADALEQAETVETCEELRQWGLFCGLRAWITYLEGRTGDSRRILEGGCRARQRGLDLLAHRLAAMAGRLAEAEAVEAEMAERLAGLAPESPEAQRSAAVLEHARGVRAMVLGDWNGAVERLQAADGQANYWGIAHATFKLFNRLNLIYGLERAGRPAEARSLRHQVEAVNPHYLRDYHLPDLEALTARRQGSTSASRRR